MQQKGIQKLTFIQTYRWYFIAFSFTTTVLSVAVVIWRGIAGLTSVTEQVYNIIIALASLVVLGVDILLSLTVHKVLKQIGNHSKLNGKDVTTFLRKLLRFSMITIATVVVGILALIVYAVTRGDTNKWGWMAENTVLRLSEIVVSQQFIWLIRKKTPVREQTTEIPSRTLSNDVPMNLYGSQSITE